MKDYSELKEELMTVKRALQALELRIIKPTIINENEAVYGKETATQLEDWENNNITCKSAGLKIADENYYVYDENGARREHFTFDEAKKINLGGWRLPTPHEWALIVAEFGYDQDGKPDGDLLSQTLNLPMAGWVDVFDDLSEAGGFGRYWSSMVYSDTNYAYYLYFSSSYVSPSDYCNRDNKLSVRLVKEI